MEVSRSTWHAGLKPTELGVWSQIWLVVNICYTFCDHDLVTLQKLYDLVLALGEMF